MIKWQDIDLKELEIMFNEFSKKQPIQSHAVRERFKQFLADKITRIEKEINKICLPKSENVTLLISDDELVKVMKQIINKEFIKKLKDNK